MLARRASVPIRPLAVLRVQLAVILALLLASCAGQFSKYFLNRDNLLGFVRLSSVGGEATIPSRCTASRISATR